VTDISSYDRWHLNGFNLCEVIVIHDGPDALGRNYADGRHQHSIAIFDTIDEARAAVERKNGQFTRPSTPSTCIEHFHEGDPAPQRLSFQIKVF
jgi:hypothetical protein